MSSTDANNHTTSSTYDNWGRVTAVTAPDNTQTTMVYDLDGNVLKAADANAAPLTLSASAAWTTGISGAALSLNGSAYASAGSNTALGNFGVSDFSVSLWVRTTSAATQVLLAKRGVQGASSFWNVNLSNGIVGMEVDGDTNSTDYLSLIGTRQINDGNWHHLTCVRSGATSTIFVDGTQDATGTGAGTATLFNTSPLTLGYLMPYGGYYFVGAMDEVRVYNRALNASEITSLAQNAPVASTANQLQSYWHFDEAGGATAFDACHTVSNIYDADDRLVQTTNGRGDIVSYTYDGPSGYGSTASNNMTQKGLLSAKMDGNGHVTTYTYTARNEPLATYYPDGTGESVSYDANGNVLTRTKADSKVIHYAYDADNRLTDITYPTLHATHFGYDADGRKTLMTDATGTTTWAYGDGVHLTSTVTPFNGYTMTLNAGYDGDGRRTLSTLVGQGSWTSTYDNAGHLHTLVSSVDGTTTFAYDPANRLTQKTKGNAEYETYAYDSCDEVTGIGFYWGDGTSRNGLVYTYDLSGNVLSCNQGFYATAYGYDGADQLTGESGSGTYPPPNYGYSYDHNGNRLTQTTNGTQTQGFTYDAHDKLTSGTAGNESDGYDANGNETSVTINGGTYHDTYDDEDRLVSVAIPGGPTDTYSYNGMGLRVGKTDSTGSYLYVCDGTSPGSPVLIDGHKLYTPGLSESLGGSSSYYDFDRLGNLWTVDGNSKNQLAYEDFSGFGSVTAIGGSSGSAFKFGGGNGCQTEADTGLVLMGHRYYDSRQGRFISQDPAGSGNNWYAYAGNNPVNNIDPTGLFVYVDPSMSGSPGDPSQFDHSGDEGNGADGTWDHYQTDGNGGWKYLNTVVHGGLWDSMNNPMSGGSPGAGMIAGDHNNAGGHQWYRSKSGDHGKHVHMGKNGPRYNRNGKEIDPRGNEVKGGGSVRKSSMKEFQKVFDNLNPEKPEANVMEQVEAEELDRIPLKFGGGDIVGGGGAAEAGVAEGAAAEEGGASALETAIEILSGLL